jgi:hypothetical protein
MTALNWCPGQGLQVEYTLVCARDSLHTVHMRCTQLLSIVEVQAVTTTF